ncbi:MAG: PAS domain S-box protein, partial [Pseudomonadota bacterium]
MMKTLYRFLLGTLRGRLIIGVAAVHAVMMTLFICDLTVRQRAMLLDRQVEEATGLSQALATSGAGWIAAADISGLQELVEAQRRYPEILFAILADEQGRVLADTDKSGRGRYMLDPLSEAHPTVLSRTPALVDIAVPAMIEGRHVGWARVGIGQKAAGEKLAQITRSGVVYALAAILIGSVIAWFMGRWITRRLYVVQETIEAVRSGNRPARSSLAGTDEAAVMAREFDSMLDALAERDAELRAGEERYRSLIEKVQTAIVLHDGEGRVLNANPLARRLLGLSADQLLGKSLIDPEWHFLGEDGSAAPVAEYPVSLVLSTRRPLRGHVMGISRPERDDISWVMVNAEPEYDESGKTALVIVSFVDVTERKRAEQERLANFRYFERMDKVNRAIQGARDVDGMMSDVLNVVLSIFDCDRAWLFYPCDPDAPSFRVPMEITKPEYPGAKMLNVDLPMPPDMAPNLLEALESVGPVTYTAGTERPINKVSSDQFGVKSMMMVALYPKLDKPWVFGLHQCSYPRVWTSEEQMLYQEIGRRLADALTGLLAYHNLLESENRYRCITESLTDYRYSVRIENGRAVETRQSPACAMVTGYTSDEFAADPSLWIRMVAPDDRELVLARVQQVLAGNDIPPIEHRIFRKDGKICWVSDTIILFKDASGRLLSYDGVIKDITERKTAEEKLRRLNRELRALSNCNQVLVRAEDEQTLLDDICRIIRDEAGYRMAWVGYAENDDAKTIRPVAWAGVEDGYLEQAGLTWADTERGCGPGGTAIRSGESTCIQDFTTDPKAVFWRDGALQRGFRSGIALPLKDESANTFGVLNVYSTEPNAFTADEKGLLEELSSDLAFGIVVLRARIERKRAEDALRESEERYRTVADFTYDWEYWVASDGRLLYVSPSCERITGYSAPEFLDDSGLLERIVHRDDLDYVMNHFREAQTVDQDTSYSLDFRILHRDGRTVWVNHACRPVYGKEGQPLGRRACNRDITERKRTENIMRTRLRLVEYSVSHSLDELLQATLDEVEVLTDSTIGFYHFIEADQRTLWLQAWSTRTLEEMCTAEGKGRHYDIDEAGVWVDCLHERR